MDGEEYIIVKQNEILAVVKKSIFRKKKRDRIRRKKSWQKRLNLEQKPEQLWREV